ncbi:MULTISPECIES: cation:proton antiporter domain-containing protein [Olivibacter]|jgi:Kef-type K+ transport system membrane component KefB|uniref:Cation:proton antiporter n=1 Tax=Olivibacter oleidegradans TaxID=760123 RepID=A0ABV6HKY2_9SPHI|nr:MULTISPECIES: cation:proton antiporter [Olivibacter]MCL4639373.1 cation:proton antiporter [Olivibacter sp. UJ_SKK_5.1]MDM8175592.1 cation:proton antiporter [Olivibacter sp. 47]QEL02334.1 cation/H(+) antiporter [Olivibacter sp. LS-1]
MRRYKDFVFYVVSIGGFSLFIYLLIIQGANLEFEKNVKVEQIGVSGSAWSHFIDSLKYNFSYPLATLLLQIIAIILVARCFGYMCRKIGQPSVIGEIIAGIVLGPSLLGAYFPDFSAVLFPASSLGNLGIMSQIGLILFMFVVGMELDLGILRNKAHEAVVVSHASIIFPFALGVALAYFIYQETAPEGVNFISYALFIGISMSITAFPVLARIVQERGLSKTKLGAMAITCAAADDITAWCILAAVIAIVKAGSLASALYTILLSVAYVALMLKFVRPFLKRIGDLYSTKESLSKPIVGIFFVILLLSSWSTEVIGIHALFGAFMAGVIMPANINFRNIFIEKVEDLALVLLLPLFFVFTGLRTQIGLLNEPELWGLCLVFILVAVVGKFAGSAIAARFVGQSWKGSLTIGALMNTRGLMELVALNIGYDLGVLSPEVFAMLVLMALVTTFMTGPSLAFINYFFKDKQEENSLPALQVDKYNILIAFGNPLTGRLLVRLANSLTRKTKDTVSVTALHLSIANELNQFNAFEYEKESFAPIESESKELGQSVVSLFKPSDNIDDDIIETANKGEFDLLLVGVGKSVFEGTLLGRILGLTSTVVNPERLYETFKTKGNFFSFGVFDERTKYILKHSKIPTGILIDKQLREIKEVIVPIFSLSDSFLLIYIQKLIQNGGVKIYIMDIAGVIKQNIEFKEAIRAIDVVASNHLSVIDERTMNKALLGQKDLLLVSLDSWKKAVESRSVWLAETPSVLILKP